MTVGGCLVLFLATLCHVLGECPDNWVTFQNSCYLFAHTDHTFPDAQKYCEHFSANVINVNDAVENTFLKSALKQFKDDNYWIGLSDEVVDGLWKLYPSESTAPFFDWNHATHEPNGGTTENCVLVGSSYDYRWIDTVCHNTNKVICELENRRCESVVVG